jgi:hypothetical protein
MASPDDQHNGGEMYEAPALTVLGTFAELTLQGAAPPDELLNDGSQV